MRAPAVYVSAARPASPGPPRHPAPPPALNAGPARVRHQLGQARDHAVATSCHRLRRRVRRLLPAPPPPRPPRHFEGVGHAQVLQAAPQPGDEGHSDHGLVRLPCRGTVKLRLDPAPCRRREGVVRRVAQLQASGAILHVGRRYLNAHDIASRIMRRDNYIVGMLAQGTVLNLELPVRLRPLACRQQRR